MVTTDSQAVIVITAEITNTEIITTVDIFKKVLFNLKSNRRTCSEESNLLINHQPINV